MLDLESLLSLPTKPIISDIDVPLLKELYEKKLHPYTYNFELSDGNVVKLNFDKNRFCHLIGLESMAETVTKNPNTLRLYKGFNGWENIQNGMINFAHMRKFAGKRNFDDGKDKFIYFYNIPKILDSADSLIKYKKIKSSRINCELIIYNIYDDAYIHLGIEKENDGKSYYPRSFWKERKTATNPGDRYVVDQTQVDVLKKEKIDRLVNIN